MARRRKSDEEAEAIGYLIAGIIMLAGIAIVVAGAVAILAVAAVVGAVYGFGIATEQFLSLIKEKLFERSKTIEDDSYVNYFDLHGDGLKNVLSICSLAFSKTFSAATKMDSFSAAGWFITAIRTIFKYGTVVAVCIVCAVYTPLLTVTLSLIFFSIWLIYLVTALLMRVFEGFVNNIYGLFNICKHCHKRVDLPLYKCPHCGTLHRHLISTVKFGPFFRTCKCGHRLPVSRFTGRDNLPSFCPHPNCGVPLASHDAVPLSVAILGGPSSGKTHLLIDAVAVLLYRVLPDLKLSWKIPPDHVAGINKLLQMFKDGETPQITRDAMIEAICIEIQSASWSFPRRLYLYDPPGESFKARQKVAQHKYYENMVAAVFVLDPSTLEDVLKDYERNGVEFQIPQKGAMPPEESLERWLLSMGQDFPGIVPKSVCSVVINKTDEPSFASVTGLKCGASDKECRKFLRKYGCSNFINTLENNFKKVRFFSASFVGNRTDSESFNPIGVSKLVSATLRDGLAARSQRHIRHLIGRLMLFAVPLIAIAAITYASMCLYSNRLVVDNEEWRWAGRVTHQDQTLLRHFRSKEFKQLPNSFEDTHSDNPELQFYMGCVYDSAQREYGAVECKDDNRAFELYELAANRGFAPAMVNLSMMYALGRGCDKDVAKAHSLCMRAVNLGYPRAYYVMGVNYRDGLWSYKNPKLALQYFQKASSKGYLKGRAAWGAMLLDGDEGIRKDVKRGLKFLTQTAELNVDEAQYKLGELYLRKDGPVGRDVKLAEYWLRKSVDNGNADGYALMGSVCLTSKDFGTDVNGLMYLQKGAEGGNLKAARLLGLIYEKGYDKNGYSIKSDLTVALKWFRVAAEINSDFTSDVQRVQSELNEKWREQYLLAMRYLQGQGVEKDVVKAEKLLEESAEGGNSDAMKELNRIRKERIDTDNKRKRIADLQKTISKYRKDINAILNGSTYVGFGVQEIMRINPVADVKMEEAGNSSQCLTNHSKIGEIDSELARLNEEKTRLEIKLAELGDCYRVHREKLDEQADAGEKRNSRNAKRQREPRREKCVSCNGTGMADCGRCKGRGTITVKEKEECPTCGYGERKGYVKERVKCSRCGGIGQITPKCRTCGGKGYVRNPRSRRVDSREVCGNCGGSRKDFPQPCPNCFAGTGEIEVWKPCSTCRGSGWRVRGNVETCPECNGDGKNECKNCDGNGFVNMPNDQGDESDDINADATGEQKPKRTLALPKGSHAYYIGAERVLLSEEDYKILEKARAGDAESQYRFAKVLNGNVGYNKVSVEVARDAFSWAMRSARQGNGNGENFVGCCYRAGDGVSSNVQEGVKWQLKAASHGSKYAKNNLAQYYLNQRDYQNAIGWARKSAKEGFSAGQCTLGQIYLNGWGVPTNQTEAVGWFKKAAEQDDVLGITFLGLCYDKGWGVSKNENMAFQTYLRAAQMSNYWAQSSVATAYMTGKGVEKDSKQAMKWAMQALDTAESQDLTVDVSWMEYYVGMSYKKGWSGITNPTLGITHLARSANGGNTKAIQELALSYETGDGCDKNLKRSFFYWKKLADSKSPTGIAKVGVFYINGWGVEKDETIGAKWIMKAAELGFDQAQNVLGNLYWNGIGVPQSYKNACIWYQKAADQDNAEACGHLAYSYLHGKHGVKSPHLAIRLFTKSADLGYVDSMWNMACCCYEGTGMAKDHARAFEWYKKAADHNHAQAAAVVGDMYRDGDGITKNIEMARRYYEKAIKLGWTKAKSSLEQLQGNFR